MAVCYIQPNVVNLSKVDDEEKVSFSVTFSQTNLRIQEIYLPLAE